MVWLQEIADKLATLEGVDAPKIVKSCSLKKPTQELVKLIFNNDMFKEAMQSMEIGEWWTHLICDRLTSLTWIWLNCRYKEDAPGEIKQGSDRQGIWGTAWERQT